MSWCAEIRSILSRLRWCDASSDVEGALSDLEKIFVQSEAWRWSKIDDIVTLNTGVVRLAEAQTQFNPWKNAFEKVVWKSDGALWSLMLRSDPKALRLIPRVRISTVLELTKIRFITLSCLVERRRKR
uniref:Bm8885 n=1 Tax=Brugia malayi TaxID=6279 RepID=A0A1I9G7N1_BRUMA|nr:Bm8885 [Brugia malayi]